MAISRERDYKKDIEEELQAILTSRMKIEEAVKERGFIKINDEHVNLSTFEALLKQNGLTFADLEKDKEKYKGSFQLGQANVRFDRDRIIEKQDLTLRERLIYSSCIWYAAETLRSKLPPPPSAEDILKIDVNDVAALDALQEKALKINDINQKIVENMEKLQQTTPTKQFKEALKEEVLLVNQVKQLQAHYKQSGDKGHLTHFQNLTDKLDVILKSDKPDKLKLIVHEIAKAYLDQEEKFRKPSFLDRAHKSSEHFRKYLNTSTEVSHYSRLLGLQLKDIFKQYENNLSTISTPANEQQLYNLGSIVKYLNVPNEIQDRKHIYQNLFQAERGEEKVQKEVQAEPPRSPKL